MAGAGLIASSGSLTEAATAQLEPAQARSAQDLLVGPGCTGPCQAWLQPLWAGPGKLQLTVQLALTAKTWAGPGQMLQPSEVFQLQQS